MNERPIILGLLNDGDKEKLQPSSTSELVGTNEQRIIEEPKGVKGTKDIVQILSLELQT